MNSSPFWFFLPAQALLRGAGWLLLILPLACLFRRASAARRALLWQLSFVGLILLPLLLCTLPPLRYIQADPAVLPAVPETKPLPIPATEPLPESRPPITHSDSMDDQKFRRSDAETSRHEGVEGLERSGHSTLHTPHSTQPYPLITPSPHHPITLSCLPGQALLWVWSVGAVLSLFSLLVSLIALHRLGRGAVAASPTLVSEAGELAGRIGLRRQVRLRIAESESGLHAPITWGIFRPVVMLPVSCAGEMPSRRAALLHELAHIRRGDWAWLLLAQIVCAFYWCVPFVWLAASRLRHETELACDDCVLAAGISAPDYAAQILEVVRTMKTHHKRLPVGALTMARPPLAQARIQAILDPHHRRHPASRLALALAALLLAFCVPIFSLRAVAASEVPDQKEVSTIPSGLSLPSASDLVSPIPLADVHAAETKPTITGSPLRFVSPDTGRSTEPQTTVNAQEPGRKIPILGDLPILGSLFRTTPSPGKNRPVAPQPAVSEEKPGKGVPILGDIPILGRMFQKEAPEGEISWGKAKNELQAGIRFRENRRRYFSGETLEVEYLIRNTGSKEITLDPSAWKSPLEPFTLIGNGSRDVQNILQRGDLSSAHTLPASGAPLKPGETTVIGSFELETTSSAHLVHYPTLFSSGGKYSLIQSHKVRLAGVQGIELNLQSGSLSFEIRSTEVLAHWGNAEHGLQTGLAISGNRQKFEFGETVQMDLYWRNVSDKPITVGYAMYSPYEYVADLETASGTSLTINYTYIDIPPLHTSATLKPGETLCFAHPRLLLVEKQQQGIEAMAEVKPGWYRMRMEGWVLSLNGKSPAGTLIAARPESDWISFEVVQSRPQENPIFWGEETRGIQLGARIVAERSRFQVGDTIKFQAFGRNLSGEDRNLSIGNYWKVNYKVQVQTQDGKPIYMERDSHNRAELVAGYLEGHLNRGSTQEISTAALKILPEPLRPNAAAAYVDENTMVEAIPLPPGKYRVRLLSWSLFGKGADPASGWIPIEVKGN